MLLLLENQPSDSRPPDSGRIGPRHPNVPLSPGTLWILFSLPPHPIVSQSNLPPTSCPPILTSATAHPHLEGFRNGLSYSPSPLITVWEQPPFRRNDVSSAREGAGPSPTQPSPEGMEGGQRFSVASVTGKRWRRGVARSRPIPSRLSGCHDHGALWAGGLAAKTLAALS